MLAQSDPRLTAALPVVEKEASQFWQTAPRFFARETLRQKAIVTPKRKLRLHTSEAPSSKTSMQDREIVSIYGFTAYSGSPEAIHEMRQVLSIDGRMEKNEAAALADFKKVALTGADGSKQRLSADFLKENLGGSALDFGQLILLFTRSNMKQFDFSLSNVGMVGATRALVVSYQQNGGQASLHIRESTGQSRRPLHGQLWVRENDSLPVRVTLTNVRPDRKLEVRDEATVDYARFSGALLPASVVYREYVNDELYNESVYEYSGWQQIEAK